MNDIDKFVFYPLLYSAIVYWGLSGFWFLLDIYLAPKYRINGGEIINWNLYKSNSFLWGQTAGCFLRFKFYANESAD